MRIFTPAIVTSLLILSQTSLANAAVDSNSPQNELIGATPTLQASANYGRGVLLGDIDTGVTPQWLGFTPLYNGQNVSNIITSQSAICLNGICRNGVTISDGNGHGTFTASEMVGGVPAAGLEGIAPAAFLISVQVLAANGNGYTNDVSNGIIYAVNHGAQVLNLSIGPGVGSAAGQAVFYQNLASAINYAAARNVYVVFAGNNASQGFAGGANITGLTDAAIAHLMLVGSTNASGQLSSYSDTPGSGYFISTTGKHYAYSSIWLMADGENILGASNYYTPESGYAFLAQASGTSMSAPQATAAAGLLIAKWPFLAAQGTVSKILEQTATDLGAKGVDAVYGDGFINLASAFQPIGTLSIPVNGKLVPLTSGGVVSGTATGKLGGLSSALSQMVAYDSYMRGFSINAPAQVKAAPVIGSASSATAKVTTGASSRTVTGFTDENGAGWAAYSGTPGDAAGGWSYGFSRAGNYVGMGQGNQAGVSFDDARWGADSAFFNSGATSASSLMNIAQTANFASVGTDVSPAARLAMSLFTTDGADAQLGPNGTNAIAARGGAIAYTMSPASNWKVSLTSSFLDESNMLLGSVSSGFLALGSGASTTSMGIGTNLDLGDGYQVGFDATYATTKTQGASDSLIEGTSRLGSESFSLAFVKNDLTGANDALHLSVDKPLRVVSGSAYVDVPTGTDMNASPILTRQRVGLAADGNETDFNMAYIRPIDDSLTSSLSFSYRSDAGNVAGAQDAAAIARVKLTF